MKFKKPHLKHKMFSRRLLNEDMQYLQKKISGRSVYKNLDSIYMRSPKHKNAELIYQD